LDAVAATATATDTATADATADDIDNAKLTLGCKNSIGD